MNVANHLNLSLGFELQSDLIITNAGKEVTASVQFSLAGKKTKPYKLKRKNVLININQYTFGHPFNFLQMERNQLIRPNNPKYVECAWQAETNKYIDSLLTEFEQYTREKQKKQRFHLARYEMALRVLLEGIMQAHEANRPCAVQRNKAHYQDKQNNSYGITNRAITDL